MGNPIFGESMADFDLFGGSVSKSKYKKPAMFLRKTMTSAGTSHFNESLLTPTVCSIFCTFDAGRLLARS